MPFFFLAFEDEKKEKDNEDRKRGDFLGVNLTDKEVINPKSATKVTTMGHITELVISDKRSRGTPCRRLTKDDYVDLRTGEVKTYKHIAHRAESEQSMRHTLARIRALVNTNVSRPECVRWVTLTYAENMTDTKRLYVDFVAFWKRFKRYCKRNGFQNPEYISVQEPQARGAWHVHAFFIWNERAPFVSNADLAKLWGQGFVSVKALNNCDNVGAYFSAYLGDIPITDVDVITPEQERQVVEKELTAPDGCTVKKKYIKGGRLHLYPPGMNIVRKSRGVREPMVERMTLEQAKKKISGQTETFSRSFEITNDDSGEIVNHITKKYYNSKRK